MRHAILIALLTVSVFAQQGPPPQAVLHDILQLDDSQMKAIDQLAQKQRDAVEPLAAQLGPAQKAVDDAIKSGDATSIGKAILAVRDLQQKIEAARHAYADGFLALLTDAQRQQVQQIRNVEAALRAAEALHGMGL